MFDAILVRYPALAERAYRTYFFGSLASVSGTQLVTFGQLWLIFELTKSELMLGVLGAFVAIPNLLITLYGGVVADRYNKRSILFFTSAANGVFTLLLVLLVVTGQIQSWHILVLAGLTSFSNGLDWPTRVAIFPQLVVSDAAYPSAVALNAFIWQITRLVIPAMAGILLQLLGVASVFTLAVIGFALMCYAMAKVTETQQVSASPDIHALVQIREGITYILNNPIFKYLLLLTLIGMFFCNSHIQFMPAFADMVGQGRLGYGFLLAAGGLGSIVGTLQAGYRSQDESTGTHILNSGSLSAVVTVAFALVATQGWMMVALAAQFLAAYFGSLFQVGAMTVMQLRVPSEIRGRVMGIHTMGYSLMPGGAILLGAISKASNLMVAVFVGSLIYLLTLAAFYRSSSTIRQIGRELDTAKGL